jgi:hypothetical protein
MKRRLRKRRLSLTLFAAVAVGLGLSLGVLRIQAQDKEKAARLEIARMDGLRAFYQPLSLNNATVRFSERDKSLWCESDLMDSGFTKGEKGQLAGAAVTVYSNAQRGWVFHGGQGFPVSKCTEYIDLDGDTVFDTMTKDGPDPEMRECYILYNDAWLQVSPPRFGPGWRGEVRAKKTWSTYKFEKGKWQLAGGR